MDEATLKLDRIGALAPIMDELKLGDAEPLERPIETDLTSDEESELPGTARPRKGAGWWGRGPPLRPMRKGIPRDFVDGAGLCSPGRWPIDRRILPEDFTSKRLRRIIHEGLVTAIERMRITENDDKLDAKKILVKLAMGLYPASPFDQATVEDVRAHLRSACKEAGHGDGLPREGDVVQLFEVRLIQSLLSAFQDPDHYYCNWWAVGTWLGSKLRKLPRTPAVFDRKVKWRMMEPVDSMHQGWQSNYPSLDEHVDLVQSQFEAEKVEGMMLDMTVRDAITEYGDTLNIASTAAIAKKGRTDEVRVLYDGTHGLDLNPGIRVRDQVRCPVAADGKVVLGEMGDEGGPHYSLNIDFSKAHRRCPTLREEWGRQACQLKGSAAAAARRALRDNAEKERKVFESTGKRAVLAPRSKPRLEDLPEHVLNEKVWVNTVGTFGVASAGYWWGRSGACIFRLAHYCLGHDYALWALLYSDDGWLTGRGEHFERSLVLFMFVLSLINAPLSWHKMTGGVQSEWVGYLLDVGRFQIGISEARAAWVARWIEDKLREQRVRLGELREGLGRLQFVAGPLEHIRPFLGPLYQWASAGPGYARPAIPIMIHLILKFIASEIKRERMSSCPSKTKQLGEIFRLDAKAEGEQVAIGGWRVKGSGTARDASWFAVKLNRRNAPWAFSRGEAFRTIASLELLGVLVSVLVLMPEVEVGPETLGTITLTCGTDNQGNMYLMDKLLTTKYPLGVILMELAVQLGRRRATLRADWIPRLQNEEADALTNWDFHHFDPKREIKVDLEKLDFVVLNDLFAAGEQYLSELNELKEKTKDQRPLPGEPAKRKKQTQAERDWGRKGRSLRERDPW